MTQALRHVVRRFADAHADRDGLAMTPIQGVGAMRVFAPTGIVKSIYKPLVCLILQGAKQVTVGAGTYGFAARQSAIVSADVPAMSRITRASRAEPYLALAIELHYWLLAGRHGQAVRGLARPDGAAHRVSRAVAVLRGEFDRPLRVERLAAAAGMSPSGFHHHFRAVTSLSPMQFQKQLRLIEARRRMRGDGLSASRAA